MDLTRHHIYKVNGSWCWGVGYYLDFNPIFQLCHSLSYLSYFLFFIALKRRLHSTNLMERMTCRFVSYDIRPTTVSGLYKKAPRDFFSIPSLFLLILIGFLT